MFILNKKKKKKKKKKTVRHCMFYRKIGAEGLVLLWFIFSNVKKIYIKKNNKNCMILHCKKCRNDNIIVISAFLQCKIIHFFFTFFFSDPNMFQIK